MKGAASIASLVLARLLSCRRASSFVLPPTAPPAAFRAPPRPSDSVAAAALPVGGDGNAADAVSPPSDAVAADVTRAPTLNGRAALPAKAMAAGLKGHTVAAVYAVLGSGYRRGDGEGWEHVVSVGVTRDLASEVSDLLEEDGGSASYVRALSFAYPQRTAMEDFADGWRQKVLEAGGKIASDGPLAVATTPTKSTIVTVGDDYEFDDEDEDMDEDDLDDYLQMMSQSRAAVSSPPAPAPLFVDNTGLTSIVSLGGGNSADDEAGDAPVVSPFESASAAASSMLDGEPLDLTIENVDKVLDEVRPYLISDGGNVSVQRVDEESGNVYLLLEGACGSCASSTVTMKMGIERVLGEKDRKSVV